jgi:hypothetical protein
MVNSELFGGVEPGMIDGNNLISDSLALGLVEMASVYWQVYSIHTVLVQNYKS